MQGWFSVRRQRPSEFRCPKSLFSNDIVQGIQECSSFVTSQTFLCKKAILSLTLWGQLCIEKHDSDFLVTFDTPC